MSQTEEYILTIDVGTTNCKSTLFSLDGAVVDRAVDSYPSYYPEPNAVEQNPEDWWAAVVQTVRELAERRTFTTTSLRAVSITGQMHGMVALGKDGQALGPCMTLRDQRSIEEAANIISSLGAKQLYNLTGSRLDPSAPAAKLCWFKKNYRSLYHQSQVFLPVKDYIRYRLTGKQATDPLDAGGTLMFDFHKGDWAEPLLEASGISLAKLPPILSPSDLAGHLESSAASQLNIPAGIPVVVGAGDDVEALGAGIVDPGVCLEHLGTTGSILICTDQPVLDPQMRLDLYPHVVPGRWLIGGSNSNAGAALTWAAQVLNEKDEQEYELVLPKSPRPNLDNPLIFLPYLSGERCPIWDPHARGLFFGLSDSHTRSDIVQAVFEGVTFSLNHILETIQDLGLSSKYIVATGNLAKERFWANLRANIFGKTLLFLQPSDPTALGAMILAGVCIGLFRDMSEGVKKTVATEDTVAPAEESASLYAKLYSFYKDVYYQNRALFSKLRESSCETIT